MPVTLLALNIYSKWRPVDLSPFWRYDHYCGLLNRREISKSQDAPRLGAVGEAAGELCRPAGSNLIVAAGASTVTQEVLGIASLNSRTGTNDFTLI